MAHWTVFVTVNAIVQRGSATVLESVARQVPTAHRAEFLQHIDAVAEVLAERELAALYGEVRDLQRRLRNEWAA